MDCSGIYAIQRKDSDECYVGSAVSVANRWNLHRGDLRKGKHHSRFLQRVHDKHGMCAFEFVFLEPVVVKADLLAREQIWLDKFSPVYNTATVAGSSLGRTHSAETLAKMSVAQKARPPHSAETRAKLSAANRARPPFSDEWRAKMSASQKARPPFSDEWRAKMSEAHKVLPPFSAEHRAKLSASGKVRSPCSAETRAKLSVASTGKKHAPHSADSRAKMSASRMGKKHSDATRANISAAAKIYHAAARKAKT